MQFIDTPDIPNPAEIAEELEGALEQGEITEEMKEKWREILRQMPVAVNNFYGDPVMQWKNTMEKLRDLEASRHAGPVGLIMKGKITPKKAAQLREQKDKGLNLVTLYQFLNCLRWKEQDQNTDMKMFVIWKQKVSLR